MNKFLLKRIDVDVMKVNIKIFFVIMVIFISSLSFVSASDVDIDDKYIVNKTVTDDVVLTDEFDTIYIEDDVCYFENQNNCNLNSSNLDVMDNASVNNNNDGTIDDNISTFGVSPIEGYTVNKIFDCADRVRNFIENNGVCPNYVDYYVESSHDGVINRLSMPDYLFLICKAIVMKYEGNNSNIMFYDFNSANINPSSPFGDSINGKIYAEDYYIYAKNVVNWYTNNGEKAPNYVNTDLGKMQYQTAIYMFSRIGQYIYINDDIPNYVTVSVPSYHSMNQYLPDYHPTELE